MSRSVVLAVALLATATSASAATLSVSVGSTRTAGRIVIEFGKRPDWVLKQHGNHVDITTNRGDEIATPKLLPRNVAGFLGGQGAARLDIVAGTKLKWTQAATELILDITGPKSRPTAHGGTDWDRPNPAWKPATDAAPLAAAIPGTLAPPPAQALTPATAAAVPNPEQVPGQAPEQVAEQPPVPATAPAPIPPTPSPAPLPVAAPLPPPPSFGPIEVPAKAEVGAVAFRRQDAGIVIFDDRLDTSSLEANADPARLTVTQLANATMLSIPLQPGEDLAVLHKTYGWQVSVERVAPHPAKQSVAPAGIAFSFGQAGHALSVADPLTQQTLLLGTLRQSSGDELMIPEQRSAPGYRVLPTWLGLAVAVSSDRADLRPTATGFVLQVPDQAAPGPTMAAARENQLGIPSDSIDVLRRRLSAQIDSAAAAAPRARGHARLAAAQTMLALGLDAEAQALLALAVNDDPAVAGDPQAATLAGAAAILAGRPDEATSLDAPSLPVGGDVELWRGLRNAARGQPAPQLGNSWPLLASYPQAVRDRIGPPVIEAAIADGIAVPAQVLNGPAYAYAQALQKQKAGDVDGALQGFDALADGRDEQSSVRARIAATELRLANNQITPGKAADLIGSQTVRWRGDRREIAMRLRIAELRQQAGQWRQALAELREVKNLAPTSAELVSSRQAAVFQALLAADGKTVSPLELVTIAGDFADSLPSGSDGDRLAGLLADKLVALDLPSRAKPVLEQLMGKSGSPAARAGFALRLAQVTLDAGDPGKAASLLQDLNANLLPAEKGAQRDLLLARARSAAGDNSGAALALNSDNSPAATATRADYLAKSGDWKGSFDTLNLLIATSVPPEGELTEPQQALVLRAATAAVHTGDPAAIEKLRPYGSRLKGPRADLFRILTLPSVSSSNDLPRAARELAMARNVPDRLNALRSQ